MRVRPWLPVLAVLAAVTFVPATVADPPEIRIEAPTVEATDSNGADASYHVKSYDPATGDATAATCDIPGGTAGSGDFDAPTFHYRLGSTTVTCTATVSEASGSATVTVVDTTPPDVSVPGDISAATADPAGTAVTFSASANDTVDGPITSTTCNPASGAIFPVGPTTVTCSATDSHNNTGTATFTVTVSLNDTTDPVVTVPSDISTTTQDPNGTVVNFSASANDNVDGPIAPTCNPASGATFPVGQTSVTCSATDAHGNTGSATFNVRVTLVDNTDPVVSVPSDIVTQAVSAGGAAVTFSVSANDNLDGFITPSCDHTSGSTFPIGQTTVTCTATDAHGNVGSASFHVTVEDRTPPTLTSMPPPINVEANAPGGSVVNFSTPTATDDIDGPVALVTCAPASGSTFPLGTTTVVCSAADSHGNTGTGTFSVGVIDTTPPHVIPPGDRSVYATTPGGINATDTAAAEFLNGASVSDIADPHPTVSTNAPAFLLVGAVEVTFTAMDASGNAATAKARLTVLPMPAPGTTPPPLPPPADRTPPDDVTDLVATGGDGLVTLRWTKPKAADFDHVVVTRSETTAGAQATTVYTGTNSPFADTGVTNGVEYRYVVAAVDKAGNRSRGVAVVAVPKAALLLAPKSGARVKKTVKFRWRAVTDAKYYNLQVFRGGTRVLASVADTKVLSVWPTRPTYVLKQRWKYLRKRYALTPGVYTWYVWPGFGPRSAAEYGELIGSSTFTVVR